jgi:O-antigen/teichoic acid export membrane protein
LLSFGLQFQAVALSLVFRGLGLNVGISIAGGLAILGIWSIAERFLAIPSLLLESAWRVSFPMMSRLLGAGEDATGILERNVALLALAMGALATGLVSSAPAIIPALLGSRWAPAADVLPPACLGLMISTPFGVVLSGYLFAMRNAGAVLLASVAATVAWYATTFPLVPALGATAVGIGALVAGLAGAVLLVRASAPLSGSTAIAAVVRPVLAAIAGSGLGWTVAHSGSPSLQLAAAAVAAGVALYLSLLALVNPALLRRGITFGRLSLREAMARDRGPSNDR